MNDSPNMNDDDWDLRERQLGGRCPKCQLSTQSCECWKFENKPLFDNKPPTPSAGSEEIEKAIVRAFQTYEMANSNDYLRSTFELHDVLVLCAAARDSISLRKQVDAACVWLQFGSDIESAAKLAHEAILKNQKDVQRLSEELTILKSSLDEARREVEQLRKIYLIANLMTIDYCKNMPNDACGKGDGNYLRDACDEYAAMSSTSTT
jgi:hypothetical protein